MQVIRIHDPARKPASWMEIVRPGQFVLFGKNLDSGAPCDGEGRPFADQAAATCVLCDSFEEARTFGEAAVAKAPALRLDVFDTEGRAHPPLLTLVHSSREHEAETHPRVLRKRRFIAWALIAAGVPLMVYGYLQHTGLDMILPAFVGLNMVIAALRLLWFNLAVRETERERQERVRRHAARSGTAPS